MRTLQPSTSLSSAMVSVIFALLACSCSYENMAVTAFAPQRSPIARQRTAFVGGTTTKTTSSSLFVLQEKKLTSEEINTRLQTQLAKLLEKDRASKSIAPQDVEVVHEDEDIIVVNKPSGVLCVPSESGISSLAQAVFEKCQSEGSIRLAKFDQMVVHRLGMDTSGLVVLAKSLAAVRGLNNLFRTRKITRQYECLVAGHVSDDQGLINLPLMRDYENPPFIRVSTDEHQAALLDLDPAVVGKKLLEAPKQSLTHYQVLSRESWNGQEDLPVTRLILTSVTGRYHQLNCHCAAFGHPIVGDTTYGIGGDASPNGGLDPAALETFAPDRASDELQKAIAKASEGSDVCIHAKTLKFRHPTTKEDVEYSSSPSF